MSGARLAAAPDERLPLRARLLFAAGSLPTNAISQTWALWLIYFYAPPEDASIAARAPEVGNVDARLVLGIALTAARLLEALDDPIIGYWSDRLPSRWGRRVPFVVLGTPAWGLLFVLLFTPPAEGAEFANVVYLFVCAAAFFLLSNLSGAPLEALLPHVARRDDDRVSVASWQVLFGVAGAAVGLSVSSLLKDAVGFVGMAVAIAGVAVLVRYVALAGVWRRAIEDRTPAAEGFGRALREMFSNPQFLAFLPSFVFFQVGLQLLTAALPFYAATVLADARLLDWTGADNEGVFTFLLTAAIIAGMLLAVVPFGRFARRAGKARAYRAAMLGCALYFPALFLVGLIPGVPALAEALVAVFVAGLPTAGVFLFPAIITADIIDYDEQRTDTRREAMFYGAQNFLEKLATAVAPLVFALVLLAGDTREDPTGVRLIGPVAGAFVFLGYLGFRRYNIGPAPRPASPGPAA